MDIKNYYFLLELSIDPPENNPEIIAEAIQKKQSVWSRLRNHPTKGTQAQQYMDMLPDIRNVMTDDALRLKEAVEAKRLFIEKEKETNIIIDRHVALLLSKGRITREEMTKLARHNLVSEERIQERVAQKQRLFLMNYKIEEQLRTGKTDPKYYGSLAREFSLDPEKITEWIQNKEQEKYKKIDAYLRRCNRRGYITPQEITSLSRLYLIAEDHIVRRTRCVIKKSGTPMKDRAEPLDKSTEKIIEDNLKIVGKSSLYDFLNAAPGADLNLLQESAHEKDNEVRKIGQKDAKTTASGTLVGHCISIFKTEENRRAYDRSLTLSRLQELDADMDVSGFSKKVYAEYISIFIKNALKLGMDIDEARQHIEGYLRKRQWKIEKPRPFIPKRRSFFLRPVPVITMVMLILTTAFFMIMVKKKLLAQEFSNTVALTEQIEGLEKKETLLRQFLEKYPDNDFTPDLQKRILSIQARIEHRDYTAALTRFEQLYQSGDLKAAKTVLTQHRGRYPKGPHEKEIDDQLARIANAVQDRNYDTLQENLTICERAEQWHRCLALCDLFMKKFPDSLHTERAAELRKKYVKIMQTRQDLTSMAQRAQRKGHDFEAARSIYLEYLEANPELPLIAKKSIVDEIAVYDKKIDRFNQAEREWTRLAADGAIDHDRLSERIAQVKDFIRKYPPEWHKDDAEYLLARLEKQKNLKSRQSRKEREFQDWRVLAAYTQNPQTPLSDRIAKTEEYLQIYPAGTYTAKARLVLATLMQHKQAEDARLAQKKNDMSRKLEEERRIGNVLKNAGGTFIDHHNGTVTDRRTGLMWCIYDAALIDHHCMTYPESLQYIRELKISGYQDWRIPTVEELQVLLQTQPLFPANRSYFFWTAEQFSHGWNKMAYIFTPSNATDWKKDAAGIEKCGSVLAVRK